MDKELKFESSAAPRETQKKDKKRKRSEAQIQQWESMRRRSTIIEHKEINIEGVVCVTFTNETQRALSCVVGEHISAEAPWTTVKKHQMIELLNTQQEHSEFYFIKDQIQNFPDNELLVGYNATSNKPNRFYVCITDLGKNDVLEMLEKMHEEEAWRVHNSIFRTAKDWCSLGSEKEVEECMAKGARPLFLVEIQANLVNLRRPKMSDRQSTEYVSFGPARNRVKTIRRKRVHLALQICPELKESAAQTNPPLPQNKWTQYEYNVDIEQQITNPEIARQVNGFLKAYTPEMIDQARCNGVFDLYKDEYQGLASNDQEGKIPDVENYKEYKLFLNVKHSKGKCISAATWHPMWSGIIACAYKDIIYTDYINSDEDIDSIFTDIYSIKYVLIWSLQDSLNPKAILESPSQVNDLKFCPYNEKLLAGGCVNGQVVVWDISSILNNNEEDMNLSTAQKGHHMILYRMLGWAKQEKKYNYHRPATVSCLEISSASPVLALKWLSPYREICNTGNHIEVEQRNQISLQFISCHENGQLHIWDLYSNFKYWYDEDQSLSQDKKKLKGWKLFKELEDKIKSRRKIYPPLQPTYKLAAEEPETGSYLPLSVIETESFPLSFIRAEVDVSRRMEMENQYVYNPVFQKPKFTPEYKLIFGSLEGHIVHAKWQNSEFPEEEPNAQPLHYSSWEKVHDGPIVYLATSPFNPGLILSVGGKVFALWRDHQKSVPLLRRYCNVKVTGGAWSLLKPSIFFIAKVDGNTEIWDLLQQSDKPVLVQNISGHGISGIIPSRLAPFQNMAAFLDNAGILSIHLIPSNHMTGNLKEEKRAIMKFLKREAEYLETFDKWQEKWNANNAEILKIKADSAAIGHKKHGAGKLSAIRTVQRQRREDKTQSHLKKKVAKEIHEQDAVEMWSAKQETHMISLMLKQRNLSEENLRKAYFPLMKFKEEEVMKKAHDKQRKKESENIFMNTVEQIFSGVAKDKHEAVTGNEKIFVSSPDTSKYFMEQYEMYKSICLQYVKNSPYKYTVNWSKLIMQAKERKRMLDELQRLSRES